jgi:DNA-directed RNA polymerase specialized sigma24 family protein
MDWLQGELREFELSNYRQYQYNLIAKHVGKNIGNVKSYV